MKIKFGKGPKVVFGGSGRHIFAFGHKRLGRAISRPTKRFSKAVRRQDPRKTTERLLGGTSTRQPSPPVPTTKEEALVAGAVLVGAATGGPAGAAAAAAGAAAKLETERKAGKVGRRAEQADIVRAAEEKKVAEAEKLAADKAVAETTVAVTAQDKKKRRLRGRTALISTTALGILGEPSVGRRRLTAF